MTDKITQKPFKKLVALDFDGVLHSYSSPWTDAETISDLPTPGAMQFLRDLVEDGRFEVVVVSSRCSCPLGVERIEEWLQQHLIAEFGQHDGRELFSSGLRVMQSDEGKLPATVTLDDRAVTFLGEWPSLDRLAAFQPWNKKPRHLRPDPLTSVAAVDALMMRIGRVAQETGCPEGVQALDWLEESARLRRQGLVDWAKAELAKSPEGDPAFLDEDDDTPVRTVAVIRADLPYRWAETAKRIMIDGVEHYLVEGVELQEGDEEMVDGIAFGIGDVPERLARYAAARGKTVDEVLADPTLAKVDRPVVDRLAGLAYAAWELLDETEHAPDGSVHVERDDWDCLSQAVTELRGLLAPHEPIQGGAVVRELLAVRPNAPSSSSLDAEFAPYADIERLIVASVPAGTPVSRASAGGDLGWRIGNGWMSVEGTDPSRPDLVRACAQSLAAIPDPLAAKPRAGDPEFVRR